MTTTTTTEATEVAYYTPVKDLTLAFYANGEVAADETVRGVFDGSELAVFFLAINQSLRGTSRNALIVSEKPLFVSLLVWRMLGGSDNPRNKCFLHHLWNEQALLSLKGTIADRSYPFIVRNGDLENTLRSYFPSQVGWAWFDRPEETLTTLDDQQEYLETFRLVTLIKQSFDPYAFVFLCRPERAATGRAVQDVFLGFRIHQFTWAPRMMVVLPS